MEFPEARTAGGLYIPTTKGAQLGTLTADRPDFFRVLLTGAGYYDDTTGADVPLDVTQGDIILTGTVSVKLFSSFPLLEKYRADSIGITRESDIQMRFKGEDAFLSFLHEFNESAKAHG